MKISTWALIASAMVATAVTAAPAGHADTTTLDTLCAAQTWPRPIPDVIGMTFQPYSERISWDNSGGALGCWDDVTGITADGRDARRAGVSGWNTITSVSPAPGTLVERDQQVTVRIASRNYDEPQRVSPCDWVSTADVANIFGFTGDTETDGHVPNGSVEPSCTYRDPGRTAVLSRLLLPGAFAVDAVAEYSLYPHENTTAITGLGTAAQCITDLHGSQGSHYNQVVVLLENNTIVEVQGLGAQPCDQLEQFAQKVMEGIAR